MTAPWEMEDRAHRLPGAIAENLYGFGGILRCMTCGVEEPLDQESIAVYLRSGWPKHHGFTMRWVTARQLEEEYPYADKARGAPHPHGEGE